MAGELGQYRLRLVEAALSLAVLGAAVWHQPPACGQSAAQPSAAGDAAAQPPAAAHSYDGIQAGLDAYRQAEQQRQAAVSQQLYLNDQLRVWNGVSPSGARVTYYGTGSPPYSTIAPPFSAYPPPYSTYAAAAGGPLYSMPPQANLDYAYGYGYTRPFGAVATPWGSLSVFEPWPYLPGNIYGYPYVPQPARQPIGRYEVQTSPTHWESGPVYAPPPPAPVQPPLAMPAMTTSPGTAAPVDKAASEPIPPPPRARPTTGPREY